VSDHSRRENVKASKKVNEGDLQSRAEGLAVCWMINLGLFLALLELIC
jgi:hypothetical protein